MPVELWSVVLLFLVIVVVFIVFKRPLYEAMAIAFIVLLAVTGHWSQTFAYLLSAAKSSILFTIVLFLLFSAILKKTGVIEDCIDIIMALVGRIPGGAGLVSIVSSAFMGAMSGSGPGNVAATGSVTIPLMKKAGYSSEFAAGVAMAGSCLGPVIPPSATIISAFACLAAVSGYEGYQFSSFWLVMYGVSLVFFIQRIAQLYIMCAVCGVKGSHVCDIPDLKTSWKKGWKSSLLVVVILLPFVLDNSMSDFFKSCIGETAAKNLSSSVLIITPAIATVYSLIIGRKRFKVSASDMASAILRDMRPIVTLAAVLFFSYAISALLTDCDIVPHLERALASLNGSFIGMTLLLTGTATFIGMFMPGTALIPLLGPLYIAVLSSYGVNPVLVASILPVLFVSLGQMTPPFAVCMYAAMGIADSDFKKTSIHAIIWSVVQFALVVLIICGIIPIPWLG